jgi:hypothetical protein
MRAGMKVGMKVLQEVEGRNEDKMNVEMKVT